MSCTAAIAPSAHTASIMNSARILRNSDASLTYTIPGTAKAIMSFLFGGVQLPSFLSHYAGFFAGFVTGALSGSVLYAYFYRNHCDRAKVKLAVYHILHVIQHGPDYTPLLQDPQELMKHIEAEVMRLVDLHLTKNEAAQVTKEVKRNYAQIASKEQVYKRIRENQRDLAKERMEPHLALAYAPSPRGFLDEPAAEQPYNKYEQAPKPILNIKPRLFGTPIIPRCNSPVQPDLLHGEVGQFDDRMDIDEAASSSCIPHVPSHLFGGSPCPPVRLPAAPSLQQSIFVGRVNTSTPALAEKDDGYEAEVDFTASPEPADCATQVAEGLQEAGEVEPPKAPKSGYGLDYDDPEVYPPSEDEDL